MAKRIDVFESHRDDRKNYVYYSESGQPWCHVFPDDALDWRCAEYDLNPSDVAGLVELILAERWEEEFDSAEIKQVARTQRTQAKLARISRVGLTIATKGPPWERLLTNVRKPTTERIEAFRYTIENRGPRAEQITQLISRGQLESALKVGSVTKMPLERLFGLSNGGAIT